MAAQKPQHPMSVYTGIKTFTILQKALIKDNLYGCVELQQLATLNKELFEYILDSAK